MTISFPQQIITLISNGELKSGQRLPSERDLCTRFGARALIAARSASLSLDLGVLNARVGEGTSVAMDGSKFWRLSCNGE